MWDGEIRCGELFICSSNDDSYGQILSLNRVHVHVHSHLFLYVGRLWSKDKNNTTLGHFCCAIIKVGFFITELKITGFHCSCMIMTLYK